MTKPTSPARRPSPPKHLNTEACAIWRHTIGDLDRAGRLSTTNQHVLESFCRAVVRERALQDEIERTGYVDKDGKPHPLLRTIEATAASVKNLAHTLGLTSGARRTLPAVAPRGKTGDVWRGVLK